MNNYILLNNKVINDNASLNDLKLLIKRFNVKLDKAYTFQMRVQKRRVIKLILQGKLYTVYTQMGHGGNGGYWETHTPHLATFDYDKAMHLATELNGYISEFDASEVDLAQPHFNTLLK